MGTEKGREEGEMLNGRKEKGGRREKMRCTYSAAYKKGTNIHKSTTFIFFFFFFGLFRFDLFYDSYLLVIFIIHIFFFV